MRQRIFERLRQTGRSPDSDVSFFGCPKFNLMERVSDEWGETGKIYRSDFWKIVQSPPISIAEVQDIVARNLRERGLRRLDPLMHRAMLRATMHVAPTALVQRDESYLEEWAAEGSLSALTLLGALCREAALAKSLALLTRRSRAFTACAQSYLSAHEAEFAFVKKLPGLFQQMIDEFEKSISAYMADVSVHPDSPVFSFEEFSQAHEETFLVDARQRFAAAAEILMDKYFPES